MNQIIRIGIDTSKHIFQLHGVDADEQPVLRRAFVITHGVARLADGCQALMVARTVPKVPASAVRRAVATTVRTAASPLADHMAR